MIKYDYVSLFDVKPGGEGVILALANQEKPDEGTPCTNSNPVYLSMVDEDGSKIKFSVASGQVVSMISATGKVMTRENYEQNNTIIRDDDGNLTAFYCATEGLMTTQTNLDGSYGMA